MASSTTASTASSAVAAVRRRGLAEHDPQHVRPPGGVAAAGTGAGRADPQAGQAAPAGHRRGEQRRAGRGAHLAVDVAGPRPVPRLGEQREDRGRRHRQQPVLGRARCPARAPPACSATSVTPRSCSAAQTPTTSASASSAPTSWKCTSSAGIPCAAASARASRAKTSSARSRTGVGEVGALEQRRGRRPRSAGRRWPGPRPRPGWRPARPGSPAWRSAAPARCRARRRPPAAPPGRPRRRPARRAACRRWRRRTRRTRRPSRGAPARPPRRATRAANTPAPKPLSMLHDDDAGRARVEHRQQGGQTAERGAVADRGGHGDQRYAGQPADHARQRALHAGHDDEAVGRVQPVAHRHQPVQPGDPDVVDPVDGRRRRPGPRRRPRRRPARPRCRPRRRTPCRGASGSGPTATARATSSTSASGNACRTAARASSGSRVASAGRPPSCRASSRQDRDRLVGRLAGRVDDLGVAGAQPAVRVDPGEAEVDRAVHRPGGQRLDGRLDRDAAGRHVAQQRLDLGSVHGRKASAGNLATRPDPHRVTEDLTRARLAARDLSGGDARRCGSRRALPGPAAVHPGPAAGARPPGAPARRRRRGRAESGTDPRCAPARRGRALRRVRRHGRRLSFSAALLDDSGDGLVLTSINGRSETRTYAKALVGLQSDHTLSPEEQQAIRDARLTARQATGSRGRMPGVPPARYAYLGPEGTFAEAGAAHASRRRAEGDLQPQPTRHRGAGRRAPRRGRPRAGADRELGRGLGAGDPRRARGRRPADGHPRGAAAGVVRADGAAGHGACTTYAGWPPTRTPRPSAGAGCATALPDAVVVPGTVDRAPRRPGWPTAAPVTTRRSPRRSRPSTTGSRCWPSDVEDNPDAVTRFVLVSRPGEPPLPTGHDKTSLVAFIADDHPGALLEVLTEFAVRGVNLTRIESRPDRRAARPLLLLDRLRGPRRRRPGRRGADRGCAGSARTSGSSAPTRGPTSARPPRRPPATPRPRTRSTGTPPRGSAGSATARSDGSRSAARVDHVKHAGGRPSTPARVLTASARVARRVGCFARHLRLAKCRPACHTWSTGGTGPAARRRGSRRPGGRPRGRRRSAPAPRRGPPRAGHRRRCRGTARSR